MIEPVAKKQTVPTRRGVALTAAIATVGLAVVLAACGSSTAKPAVGSETSTSAPSATAPASTTSPAPNVAPVVMSAANATLGSLLVDASGKTLYTLTDAAGTPVACTGGCLKFWPPLLLAAGATAATGTAGITGLATVASAGGEQVTDNGAPLYRFAGDAAAGDAHGEGISSFGGVWHVVKAAAAPSPTVAPTTPPTTPAATTTTAGGYHYP